MGYFGNFGDGSSPSLWSLLAHLASGAGGAGAGSGLGGDLHSWLASLPGGGTNPQQGTGLGFAPALGPGGTGSGTGSGVGPYLPNTASPSLAELTGSPATPGMPGAPYAYGGAAPATTGIPEASAPPSAGAYPGSPTPMTDYSSLFRGGSSAQGQQLLQIPAQWMAAHQGLGPDAMSATAAALSRAAAYRQMLLGG
jgi:hypothetical protein